RGMRQYLPSKPKPLGLEHFVLASPDGLVLDYVIYTGKNTVLEEDIKMYGLGGAVVKKLVVPLDAEDIPTFLFADRYLTGIIVIEHLAENNLFLTGTVVANRTDDAALTFPKDKQMSKGTSVQKDKMFVMCTRTKPGETPAEHRCFMNWKGSSTSM
ncbi:hypothetical protein HPB47_024903, partial [Ixodes persulcatus]